MDIGGDFYDVIPLSDTRIAVAMGDISGHGISAALLTAMLLLMIRTFAPRYQYPDKFMFYLNQALNKIFENGVRELYVCLFFAVIDTQQKKIIYSNAGQALPILVHGEDEAIFLDSSGLPIGMMPDAAYEVHSLAFDEGDMVVFITDGIQDVFYKDNPEEFAQKFKEVTLDAKSLDDPKEIIEMILNAFYNYNAQDSEKFEMDDVSLILCKM
jgi:sigma-B regulation protein RsbU (phosphoserine phosphatase)